MTLLTDAAMVAAVCERLDAAAVGEWRPTGPAYGPGEVGIYYGPIGPSPDQGIGVTMYQSADEPATGSATRWIQIRLRGMAGDVDGADMLADAVFAALHDTYPRAGIARIIRTTSAPLGTDDNGRQERADNYQVTLDNPEATP